MPIDVDRLHQLLIDSAYHETETRFLVNGFRFSFDLGYRGSVIRKTRSRNLPLRCGTLHDIWEKMMKEVSLGRFAGPFKRIPFSNFVQSPIGLVPKGPEIKHEDDGACKDGGSETSQQTRLIFYLSYPENASINYYTPSEMCTVKYKDLDHAIRLCLKMGPGCCMAKSDLKSAFRPLPIRPQDWCWLVTKVYHPGSVGCTISTTSVPHLVVVYHVVIFSDSPMQ